jgi:hypothetical protein
MKKVFFIALVATLGTATVHLFTSCSKGDGEDTEDEYLEFMYNGEKVSYSSSKFFDDGGSVCFIGGQITSDNNQLLIYWNRTKERPQTGKTYDITADESGIPNIEVVYQNIYMKFLTSNKSVWKNEKIGEITIAKRTDDRLRGTFKCKMDKGEITEGKFDADFTRHWYSWF